MDHQNSIQEIILEDNLDSDEEFTDDEAYE